MLNDFVKLKQKTPEKFWRFLKTNFDSNLAQIENLCQVIGIAA